MKQVTHAINEYAPLPFPLQRLFQAVAVKVDGCLARQEWTALLEPQSHSLGVAMGTSGAGFGTPCHRVPGRISPLDRRLCVHVYLFTERLISIVGKKSRSATAYRYSVYLVELESPHVR